MTRNFIANLAFLLFLNLLVKPISILLDIQVQNEVGAELYGLYFAVFNLSYLFHLALDLGINNYNNRSVARDSAHLGQYLPSLISLKLLLAGVYTVITLTAGYVFGFEGLQWKLLGWLIVNQIMLSAILFFRSSISGMHLFRVDSIVSVMDKVLLIGLLAYLLFGGCDLQNFRIEWFVWAQTASLSTTALFAGTVVALRSKSVKFTWAPGKVWELLKHTYPYALLGVLMSIYYRIDGVMIERLLPNGGAYEAGAYAASYRLLEAANIVGLLFANLLLPMFARLTAQHKPVAELVEFSFKLLFTASLLLSGIVFVFSVPIMQLLYPDATPYWGEILAALFTAFAAVSTVYVYGSLLTANGSLRALNFIALAGAIVNIGLNFVLIPQYQAFGATIATVATQWLVAGAHVLVARRVFELPINGGLVLRLVVFVMGLGALLHFGNSIFADWKINLLLLSICGLVWAFVLRLFDLPGMLQLLKSREA